MTGEQGARAAAQREQPGPDLSWTSSCPGWIGYEVTRGIKADPALEARAGHSGDFLCAERRRTEGVCSRLRRLRGKAVQPALLLGRSRHSCLEGVLTRDCVLRIAIHPSLAPHAADGALRTSARSCAHRPHPGRRRQSGQRRHPARAAAAHGYEIVTAADGEEALAAVREHQPDLILLDVMMPKLDGIEVCRRLRADAITAVHSDRSGHGQVGLEGRRGGAGGRRRRVSDQAGGSHRAGSARQVDAADQGAAGHGEQFRSGTVRSSSASSEQLAQLERLGRLKRFFSPQLAELILSGGAEDPLKSHRREVTVVFLDLRGFTAFAETTEPEEIMGVLREYHAEMGQRDPGARRHARALRRRRHDGVLQRSGAGARSGCARGAHGAGDARAPRGADGEVAQARLRSGVRRGHRARLCDDRRGGLRGTMGLWRHRQL